MITKIRILKPRSYNFFGSGTRKLEPGMVLKVPEEMPVKVADEWIYMGWAEEVKE